MNWLGFLMVVIFMLGLVTSIDYACRLVIFTVRWTWSWYRLVRPRSEPWCDR